ncbi:MAG TPA: hypothetical protein VE476_10850 [Propionibacteriaceae bacterium]|jgi:hypothetical protein|nr:hypothetical protein [Propionibacteriaceae bacterium]
MAGKSKITLFNPEQTPAVYDAAGHTVAGIERVEVDELDAVGQRAVDTGVLVREEAKESPGEPKGQAAHAAAPPLPESGKAEKHTGASSRGKTD